MEYSTKNKRVMSCVFGIILLCTVGPLFASPQQEKSIPQELTIITDMRNRSVAIPKTIHSVIALGAGSLRLISYVDAIDKVVAVEDVGHGREKSLYEFFDLATYRIAVPALRELPSIGSSENHEGIIAANPDIIISSVVDVAQLDQLQRTVGIPVIGVDVDIELYESDLFFHQLRMLGEIFEKEKRAEELITGIQLAVADITQRRAQVNSPKTVYAGGMMFYGPASLLRTTGDYLPFDLTGAVNVMPTNPTGNRQPYMTSIEELIAREPEYVFIDAAHVKLSHATFLEQRRVLEDHVPAFRNTDVYTTFVYKYYGTNWENQLINVYYVGKTLYPELYSDIDIEKKAIEIWELFFGVSLAFDQIERPSQVDWFR